MVLISFTNIIVDDFSYGKRNPLKRYIYFLTHMHSDHYQGMSNGWDYGKIYCSNLTKALLLVKFPLQKNASTIPMKTPTEIVMDKDKRYRCQVTFLDANHCPGSVMILFQGYFGTILHTGDMRFNMEMITQNPILYPQGRRESSSMEQCSIHIDEMILDNTYCDPIFKFPNRDEAFKMICEIIDKNPNKRVLLCVDSVGKEELMVQLSEHYHTLIVVNEQRFEMIVAMDYHRELFTTNKEDGWIEVIRKGEVQQRMVDHDTIAITATGWANTTSYQMPDNRKYIIPYSLHSNFQEMHQFVSSIRPCLLQKVVKNRSGKSDKIYNITSFTQYMTTLHYLKQRGFEFFLEHYVNQDKLSKEYKEIMLSVQLQRQINQDLGITLDEEDMKLINKNEFQEKHQNIFQNKSRVSKGVKMLPPEQNDNFKITQFIRAKKQYENQVKATQSEFQVIESPVKGEVITIDSQKEIATSKRADETQVEKSLKIKLPNKQLN